MTAWRDSRIFVAGHRGLVGSAIVRRLRRDGDADLVLRTRAELDLRSSEAVRSFFQAERPDHVFMAAAKVGGIMANDTLPADFIGDNLAIAVNVIRSASETGVKRLVFLGSSCAYPKLAPQPIREEHLLTGELEPTNLPYAVAKIAGIEMCRAYNRQYGTEFIGVMPSNVYGPGDNYDLEGSHVLAALIRRFHTAAVAGDPTVVVWGSGTPRREFLYVDDLADACAFLMEQPFAHDLVNIGTGIDYSIEELARTIAALVGFEGDIEFDRSKPDGTPRKLLDVSRMRELGWEAPTGLDEGLTATYAAFQANVAATR